MNVGPSKGPMVFLILFAGCCLGYLFFMIKAVWPYQKLIGSLCFLSVLINLVVFLKCMLGDPGIKERIFHHYIQIMYEITDESALSNPNTSDSSISEEEIKINSSIYLENETENQPTS